MPEAPYAVVEDGHLGFDWTLNHRGDAALEERATRLLVLNTLPQLIREFEDRHAIDDVHLLGFSEGAGYRVTLRTFPGGYSVPRDQLDAVALWILASQQAEADDGQGHPRHASHSGLVVADGKQHGRIRYLEDNRDPLTGATRH